MDLSGLLEPTSSLQTRRETLTLYPMAPRFEKVPYEGAHSEEDLELFGPYRFLVPIVVNTKTYLVPAGNSLLRGLQFIALRFGDFDLPWGRYCWNDTVGCCRMRCWIPGQGGPETVRACRLEVRPGLEVLGLPDGARRRESSALPPVGDDERAR